MNAELTDAITASWSFPLWATVSLVLTGVVYLRGWQAARRTRPLEMLPWRAGCFIAGLAIIWLAIASPLDVMGGWLLLAHMVQHLLLMSVAPPLLLLGSPIVPLLRGLPRGWVRDGLGPFFRSRVVHAIVRFLTHPATGWIAMNAAYLGWHAPAAYELALRSPFWHEVEHACFLLTSLLFWWTVLQPWPSRARWSRWTVVPYLITADLANTALSALLAFSSAVLYPTYAAAPRIFGLSAMQDQAAAGAFMWVAGSSIYLVPAIGITLAMLSRSTPQPGLTQTLVTIGGAPAAGKLAAQQKPCDLLRVPALGKLLRARYGRQSLQAISLFGMVIVIAHGLFGHPMAAMNLAGVLPWNVLRALGILALLFAGNLFCMACPFTLPRELGRRLGWARFRWPRWLRVKWIGVGLMLAFFFSYERFALWNNPARTAWLLVAYTGTAFLVDSLFQGASFCKYICPIGQFNFVGALISPTTLRVRSQETCGTCTTRDCIRGNAEQRGCELELYLPHKSSNADCTLCMDCVKACPHDNIGILPRSVTQDILSIEPTSSLGTVTRRVDLAAAALMLVCAAFANAAVMVTPGARFLAAAGQRLPWLSTGEGSLAAVVMATVAAALLVGMTGAGFIREAGTRREAFCRSALALVPLGMGMWAAHLVFHLTTSAPILLPLFQQAAQDFGFHLLGAPHWVMTAGLRGNGLLQIQLLSLDGGLLLSLYMAWRMATGLRVMKRLIAATPFALLTIALYVFGFWLLLQPMQMRGMMMGGM